MVYVDVIAPTELILPNKGMSSGNTGTIFVSAGKLYFISGSNLIVISGSVLNA